MPAIRAALTMISVGTETYRKNIGRTNPPPAIAKAEAALTTPISRPVKPRASINNESRGMISEKPNAKIEIAAIAAIIPFI